MTDQTDHSDLLHDLFALDGRVAAVTGGSGALGGALALGLARAGARVAVLGRRLEPAERMAASIRAAGGEALGLACDALDRDALEATQAAITRRFGPVDILVNGAGGNDPHATTDAAHPFFNLDATAVQAIFAGNFLSAFQASQVFGRAMAERGDGCILNITSMNGLRPLTRVGVYSAAKAAVANFTQWLATHMAQEYSPAIRVNAIAPGFFLTEQNRYLLSDAQTGQWTPRGQAILAHTPMGRFGAPEDLVGAALWLVSPAAAFVTGVVVPVDGGFSAYSGV
ncbi:MAG TPA: SDR family NAD(P)-dependent oxidoreductase [Ktedonobacterales bacterium]|jgi:NAD(P)-dependent dehydrogenase (short-subunit alcohol dehydrogenase family)|nr:SDR family NAD(P)-dependent oxidoreductase [Ktedonobacterales bacterium]